MEFLTAILSKVTYNIYIKNIPNDIVLKNASLFKTVGFWKLKAYKENHRDGGISLNEFQIQLIDSIENNYGIRNSIFIKKPTKKENINVEIGFGEDYYPIIPTEETAKILEKFQIPVDIPKYKEAFDFLKHLVNFKEVNHKELILPKFPTDKPSPEPFLQVARPATRTKKLTIKQRFRNFFKTILK